MVLQESFVKLNGIKDGCARYFANMFVDNDNNIIKGDIMKKEEVANGANLEVPALPEIKTKLVLVTPKYAEILLKENKLNRPISNQRVVKYANDMKNGNWKATHQGIAFDKEGNLTDGQHRLYAVIMSQIPVYMNITTGLEKDCFDVLDTGGNRSKSDVLSISGVAPRIARIISSAVPYCVMYDEGNTPSRSFPSRYGNANNLTLEYFEKNPKIYESATFITKMPRGGSLLRESVACFVHFQISKLYNNADEFMTKLLTGDKIESGSIIFEMRKTLLSNRMGNFRIVEPTLINRVLHTYNKYNSGVVFKDPKQVLRGVNADSKVRII